ncbi:putative Ig domain-containing protein [Novosphingobium sp. 1Y9A]|uniref:Ig domain-containing protein n=2 Tax=Novosphingobium jiangmenense TaxID=2791981 RepID=A0ABS0HCG9_9SPHN|nr:putative Ig domain-containing protein [Novosphingobium jiangmenense]
MTIDDLSLPAAQRGVAYNFDITTRLSGGTPGYTFALTSGPLPTSLSLSTAGVVSGLSCDNTNGSFPFTVTITDGNGSIGTFDLSINMTAGPGGACSLSVNPASINDTTTVGTSYSSTTITPSGTGPYTYSLTSGALPAGVTLSNGGATAQFTGTPTAVGTFDFTYDVTDTATGLVTTLTGTIKVDPATIAIGPASLPNGTNGAAYSQGLVPSGGTGPYTCSVTSGTLPDGLSLTDNTISGTPTAAGSYDFTVTCTDRYGSSAQKRYTLVIDPGQVLTLNPASLPNGTNGSAYSQTLSASGGTGSGYTFSLTTGSLPPGLVLTPGTGVVSGTPTTPGSYSFTARVVDSAGNYQTRNYTIVIAPGALLNLGPQSLESPMQGINYASTVVATGGSGTGYVYSLDSGSLPSGLTLNPSTGVISGKTLASGTYTFTVRAVDSQGNYGTRTYVFTIRERPDPTLDPEVRGIVASQLSTTSRFAQGQLNNTMRHMESLHSGLRCGANNDLRVTDTTGANVGNQTAPVSANDKASAKAKPVAVVCDDEAPKIAAWSAGSIDRATDDIHHFNADAVTFGFDVQVGPKVIAGAAFGYGWNKSNIGTHGSRTSDSAKSALGYASITPAKSVFLDLAVGGTWVDLGGRRYVTSDSSFAGFTRKGNVTFGSAALSVEKPMGAILVAGSVRYDYMKASLDGFGEVSASPYALTYNAAKQTTQNLTAGLRMETNLSYDWGRLKPMLRADLRHHVSGNYDQVMAYSDLLTRTYTLRHATSKQNNLSLVGGITANIDGTELTAEYGTSSTAEDGLTGGEVRIMVRLPF